MQVSKAAVMICQDGTGKGPHFGAFSFRADTAGFSLVELVMVLVILGILAVVAIPRFTGGTPYEARGYFDELVAAARYTQLQATVTGCRAQFQIDGAGNYALFHEDLPCGSEPPAFSNQPMTHPTRGGAFTGTAPSGVTVTGNVTVVFNALGVPDTNPVVTVDDGGVNRDFQIHSETGYVEVQ